MPDRWSSVDLATLDVDALTSEARETLRLARKLVEGESLEDVAAAAELDPAELELRLDEIAVEWHSQHAGQPVDSHPDDPTLLRCAHCGKPLVGRVRVYCDAVCKHRAYRRRRAGLAEDALPSGRRGPVPLAGTTLRERLDSIAAMRAELGAAAGELRPTRAAAERRGRVTQARSRRSRARPASDPDVVDGDGMSLLVRVPVNGEWVTIRAVRTETGSVALERRPTATPTIAP